MLVHSPPPRPARRRPHLHYLCWALVHRCPTSPPAGLTGPRRLHSCEQPVSPFPTPCCVARACRPCSRHATDDPRPCVPGKPPGTVPSPRRPNLPLVAAIEAASRLQHVRSAAQTSASQPAAPAAGRSAARRPAAAAAAPRDVRARVSRDDVEDAIATNPLFNKWVLLQARQQMSLIGGWWVLAAAAPCRSSRPPRAGSTHLTFPTARCALPSNCQSLQPVHGRAARFAGAAGLGVVDAQCTARGPSVRHFRMLPSLEPSCAVSGS